MQGSRPARTGDAMLLAIKCRESTLQFTYLGSEVEEQRIGIDDLVQMTLLRFPVSLPTGNRRLDGGRSAFHGQFFCYVEHWCALRRHFNAPPNLRRIQTTRTPPARP